MTLRTLALTVGETEWELEVDITPPQRGDYYQPPEPAQMDTIRCRRDGQPWEDAADVFSADQMRQIEDSLWDGAYELALDEEEDDG